MPPRDPHQSGPGDESPTESGDAVDARPGRVSLVAGVTLVGVGGADSDRYVLLDPVGRGGSADVYTAFDRKLDRKIAIKLIRSEARAAEGRLLREAQALARLRHPHVVTVYDAGTLGDRVFVAMELIDGQSLRGWLAERPRGWREILGVLLAAGEGLAAVHAAALVHRDFKPDNVLVGKDGSVRVADFGLVRSAGETSADGVESPAVGASFAADLTDVGAVVGTPRYMSPEQGAGSSVDARSDQFSFCAALYQALHGQSPFAGETAAEIGANVAAGRIREPPAGKRVPGWLAAALRRGLEPSPAARWPSMPALLAELRRDRTRWLRRAGIGVGAGLVAAAVALVVIWSRTSGPPPCLGSEARLAGVWDPAIRAAVERGFVATGKSYAADASARVAQGLDGYTSAWVAARTDACRATVVRHEQSEALLDLRMACYDLRLGAVRALSTLFAEQPDGEIVDHAVAAVAQLDDLSRCSDVDALLGVVRLPADPAIAASVTALQDLLQRANASVLAGRYHAARAAIEALVPAARLVGYPPLLADVLGHLGPLRRADDDYAGAAAALGEAVTVADEGHDDAVRSAALLDLAGVAYDRGRYDEALAFVRATQAVIRRRGHDAGLEIHRLELESMILDGKGDFAAAFSAAEQALHDTEAKFPRTGEEAEANLRVGLVAYHLGDLDAAERAYQRAFSLTEQLKGRDHPDVADPLLGLALVAAARGDYESSLADSERELRVTEAAVGPNTVRTAVSLGGVGRAQAALGQAEAAVATFGRALAILHATLPGDRKEADFEDELAAVLLDTDRVAEAATAEEHALAIYDKLGTPHEPAAAQIRAGLARARARQGRAAEALPLADEALADEQKSMGADNASLAYPLAVRGEILLALHRPREAAASYGEAARLDEKDSGETTGLADELVGRGEALFLDGDAGAAVAVETRALAILEAKQGTRAQLGRAELALARALAAQKTNPARVAQLAEKAHADLVAAGPGERARAGEAVRFLDGSRK